MIIGTGNDLVNVDRVESLMARYGERFAERYFTDTERQTAESRRGVGTEILTYAKRFAAKEACSKALGTGINHGVYMKDIGVINDEEGRPALQLTGGAAEKLNTLVPPGMKPHIHLSLSDEPPLAQAHVIIEART